MSQQQLFIERAALQRVKPKRDPNLDNKAVMKHREIIHLRANYIQREEIAYRIEDSERGLRIWEATLVEWMLHGRNPKDVLGMLKSYDAMTPNGNGHI